MYKIPLELQGIMTGVLFMIKKLSSSVPLDL